MSSNPQVPMANVKKEEEWQDATKPITVLVDMPKNMCGVYGTNGEPEFEVAEKMFNGSHTTKEIEEYKESLNPTVPNSEEELLSKETK